MSDSPRGVASEWEAELASRTAVEKVSDMILQVDEPLRVAALADRADVASDTARKYLEFLDEIGVAKRVGDDPVTYCRNDSYVEWRTVDRLQRNYTVEALENRLSELSEQIASFEEIYETTAPSAVVPQERGYENIDETLDDLRQWEAARDEIDRIIEALGRGNSAPNASVDMSAVLRVVEQLRSEQPNSV